jgi:hypothetical protein
MNDKIVDGIIDRRCKNPLRPLGMTKKEIKEMADRIELISWNPKPYGLFKHKNGAWYYRTVERNYCKLLIRGK